MCVGLYCLAIGGCDFDPSKWEVSMPEDTKQNLQADSSKVYQKATFAAGCFWSIQETYRKIPGVISTSAGYTGGAVDAPTYQQVCSDTTGHAEAVQITYDPEKVSYEQLLAVFWKIHDPTTLNRQGPDVGTQYRSAIFYHSDSQKELAEASKQKLSVRRNIVTQILPATQFYDAEEYHQLYLQKKGLSSCSIDGK